MMVARGNILVVDQYSSTGTVVSKCTHTEHAWKTHSRKKVQESNITEMPRV